MLAQGEVTSWHLRSFVMLFLALLKFADESTFDSLLVCLHLESCAGDQEVGERPHVFMAVSRLSVLVKRNHRTALQLRDFMSRCRQGRLLCHGVTSEAIREPTEHFVFHLCRRHSRHPDHDVSLRFHVASDDLLHLDVSMRASRKQFLRELLHDRVRLVEILQADKHSQVNSSFATPITLSITVLLTPRTLAVFS